MMFAASSFDEVYYCRSEVCSKLTTLGTSFVRLLESGDAAFG